MKVWIMNLKDNREKSQSKSGDEKFLFCMSRGIVGIGWAGCDPETSDDGAFLRAHMYLNSFEIGDLVWVRNIVTGEYYVCSITEKAEKAGEDLYNQNDIGEFCRCKFISVGNSEALPDGITAERLISRTTISSVPEDIAVITKKHFSYLQPENTGEKKKEISKVKEKLSKLAILKKPKVLIPIIAVIVALGIATGAIIRNNIYYKNLSCAFESLESLNKDAENAGNSLGRVWQNTIYKKSDPDTDPYTKSESNGRYFNDDFNDSLDAFCGEKTGVVVDLDYLACKAGLLVIDYNDKDIKNPPSKYKEAYEAVLQYRDSVQSLAELVVEQDGHSYNSYIEAYHEKVDKADADYRVAKRYFE